MENCTMKDTHDQNKPHFYSKVIGYLQSTQCSLSMKLINMFASLIDLKVLTLVGEGASKGLAEIGPCPDLCLAFSRLSSVSVLRDSTAWSGLEWLGSCNQSLNSVVEAYFMENQMTHFPDGLKIALRNLKSIDFTHIQG